MAAFPESAWSGSMSARHIGFIGSGNMAGSIVLGLLGKGWQASRISMADIDFGKVSRLEREHGVNAVSSEQIGGNCDLIVLAVKPQSMMDACAALRPALGSRRPLVMSVAAGVTLARLAELLGDRLPIARCMPNTPALIGCGASGLFANALAGPGHRQSVEELMRAVGICVWCERESDLDIVTALSGSGPAYFFLFMEAMQNAAQKLGLDTGLARQLTCQTALGAARLVDSSELELETLRARVTSPGGTTEAAVRQFEENGLRQLVETAIAAAAERAGELARASGQAP